MADHCEDGEAATTTILLLLLPPTFRPETWWHVLIKCDENIPPKNTFSKCRLAEMKTYDAPIGVGGTPQSAPMAAHPWGDTSTLVARIRQTLAIKLAVTLVHTD